MGGFAGLKALSIETDFWLTIGTASQYIFDVRFFSLCIRFSQWGPVSTTSVVTPSSMMDMDIYRMRVCRWHRVGKSAVCVQDTSGKLTTRVNEADGKFTVLPTLFNIFRPEWPKIWPLSKKIWPLCKKASLIPLYQNMTKFWNHISTKICENSRFSMLSFGKIKKTKH